MTRIGSAGGTARLPCGRATSGPRRKRQATLAEHAQEEQALLELISDPGEPPRVRDEAELELVLDFYCGECHGSPMPPSGDGLYMESLEYLISVGKIVPGNAEMSRLVSRVRAGEMPPVASGAPPVRSS